MPAPKDPERLKLHRQPGTYRKREYWTEEEIEILKTHYPTNSIGQMEKLLPRHPENSIGDKALDLHLTKAEGHKMALRPRAKEALPNGYKRCTNCKTVKKLEHFYFNQNRNGFHSKCIICYKAAVSVEKRTTRYFKRTYNLTPEVYHEMHEKQGGVCAICKHPETQIRHGKVDRLVVDHNHSNGNVRGLLCAKCNQALGALQEDPTRIKALLQYVEQYSS